MGLSQPVPPHRAASGHEAESEAELAESRSARISRSHESAGGVTGLLGSRGVTGLLGACGVTALLGSRGVTALLGSRGVTALLGSRGVGWFRAAPPAAAAVGRLRLRWRWSPQNRTAAAPRPRPPHLPTRSGHT